MKSRITIEVDFEAGNIPVIQILQCSSDDVRDKLIKSFTENLGGSSWCQIRWLSGSYDVNEQTKFEKIFITPINEKDLKEQAETMLEQYKINSANK